jgi:hypothetical protein
VVLDKDTLKMTLEAAFCCLKTLMTKKKDDKSQIIVFLCFYLRGKQREALVCFARVLPFGTCNNSENSYFRLLTFNRDAFFRVRHVT